MAVRIARPVNVEIIDGRCLPYPGKPANAVIHAQVPVPLNLRFNREQIRPIMPFATGPRAARQRAAVACNGAGIRPSWWQSKT